jgi:hypothetical protein
MTVVGKYVCVDRSWALRNLATSLGHCWNILKAFHDKRNAWSVFILVQSPLPVFIFIVFSLPYERHYFLITHWIKFCSTFHTVFRKAELCFVQFHGSIRHSALVQLIVLPYINIKRHRIVPNYRPACTLHLPQTFDKDIISAVVSVTFV